MIGGKNAELNLRFEDIWYSSDGHQWQKLLDKTPFGSRSGHTSLIKDGAFMLIGGMSDSLHSKNNMQNDIWQSNDGFNWVRIVDKAKFDPRKLHSSVIFKNNILVIGGMDIKNRPRN